MRRVLPLLPVLSGCWTGAVPPQEAPASAASPAAKTSASVRTTHATPSTAAARCDVVTAPPVAATTLGRLRFELPPDDGLDAYSLIDASGGVTIINVQVGGNVPSPVLTLSAGTYRLTVETRSGLEILCDGVRVESGGMTTVTIVH